MIVIIVLMVIIAIFTYMIILGANINKTEEERRIEDGEQMKALEEQQNGVKKFGKKNI